MNTRTACYGLVLLTLIACGAYAGGRYLPARKCCKKVVCPKCHCVLEIEEDKEEKHCYKVECEEICIPEVRFPWHMLGRKKCCGMAKCSGPPRCARVKTIRVLKKEEYECKKCKCKWTPKCTKCGCTDDDCDY